MKPIEMLLEIYFPHLLKNIYTQDEKLCILYRNDQAAKNKFKSCDSVSKCYSLISLREVGKSASDSFVVY